jgi:hypothetical protein
MYLLASQLTCMQGETIEYDHTSHKAMSDYTAYMLAEMLKGTFKPYVLAPIFTPDTPWPYAEPYGLNVPFSISANMYAV